MASRSEFAVAAGLQDASKSRRKSSAERILEETLKTNETSKPPANNRAYYEEKQRDLQRRLSLSRNENDAATEQEISSNNKSKRKTSLYALKQVAPPIALKGRRVSLRTQNLFDQFEKDMSPDKRDLEKERRNSELTQICHGRRTSGEVKTHIIKKFDDQ